MATVSLTGDWLQSTGNRRQVVGKITFSNSYTTNGESVTAAMIGLGVIDNLDMNQGVSGLIFQYDLANSKVKVLYPTGGASASPGALAAPKVTTGGSTASAVNATTPDITPGQAKEVANTTDLSSVVIDFVAFGR